MALGNTWLALPCLLACVVALWTTRTYYCKICTLILCAGPIEGCSAVLAVRTYCGFQSLVCAFVVCAKEKKQVQKQKLRGGLCSSEAIWLAELMIQLALSKKSTFPAVMFPSRLVLPSAMTWTEKSACFVNLPRSHTHAGASCCCCCHVAVLLYCGWLWCCYYCCLALSSLVACKEKTKEKNNVKKEKDETQVLSFRGYKKRKTKNVPVQQYSYS